MPGIGSRTVFLVSGAIRITRRIKPMASPTFPKIPGLQQANHELLEYFWRTIFAESLHLLRLWRQANQVEINPANQFSFGRCIVRANALPFQPRQDELID